MAQRSDAERGETAAQRALAALASRPIYDDGAAGAAPHQPPPDHLDGAAFLRWVLGAPGGSELCDPGAAWTGGSAAAKRAGLSLFRPALRRADLRLGDVILSPASPLEPALVAVVAAIGADGSGRAVACSAHYQRLFGSALALVEAEGLEARPLARLMRPNFHAIDAAFALAAA